MKEPLNLPRGSVRALIAVLVVGAAIASVFLPVANEKSLDALLLLAGVVARDYFATRQTQNDQDGPVVPNAVIGS